MIFGGGNIGGNIGTGIVFTLHDQFTATSRRIESGFTSLDATTATATANIARSMNTMRSGFLAVALGGAVLLALAFPVSSAIEFESAFTGVRKTVTASEAEFEQLSQNFRDIAKNAPIAASELAKIGELAGQLGVSGVDNLTKFTDTISKISVTTNLTSESAATDFARIANIMQEPIDNVDRMGSSVVDLGNKFATNEAEIVSVAYRLVGAANVAVFRTGE